MADVMSAIELVFGFELLEAWSEHHGSGKVHRYDEATDRTRCGREPSIEWSAPTLKWLDRSRFCSACFGTAEVFIVSGTRIR